MEQAERSNRPAGRLPSRPAAIFLKIPSSAVLHSSRPRAFVRRSLFDSPWRYRQFKMCARFEVRAG